MTTETKSEPVRIDDNTIELKTTITQRLTNQEFYDLWANMGMAISQNEKKIKQNEQQIEQSKLQIEINTKQKEDLTKLAKDCEVRIPSKVPEKIE